MSIIRSARNDSCTLIPNDIINDPDLGSNELALLVFLLSRPDNWRVTIESLRDIGRFGGNHKLTQALKRLRELGYVKLHRFASGNTEWLITDERGTFGDGGAA